MKLTGLLTLAAALACAQGPVPPPTLLQPEEKQELLKALNEATTSSVDLIRALEAHLKKYPQSPERKDIDRAIVKAAMEMRDDERIVEYGERVLELVPDDVAVLDRVMQSLLVLGGNENAAKAYKYARSFEELIAGMSPPEGKDAAQRQEDRDRALGRTLLNQARARAVLGEKDEVVRLAARAFSTYPSEENAREWAGALLKLGREEEALARLADAFAIPDPRVTDSGRLDDRLRLGEIYSKLKGSEKGLGDLILAAYDRTSTLVEARRKKLLAMDPNAAVLDPMDFTVTGLDGKKLKLASLRGRVLVLDFWATWCEPCRTQHPMYEELKKFFGNRADIAFLGINTDEDRALVEPFLTQQNWEKNVYYEDGLARLLQVTSIPTTILFDKRGRLTSRMNGFVPNTFMEQMKGRIQAALDDLGSTQ